AYGPSSHPHRDDGDVRQLRHELRGALDGTGAAPRRLLALSPGVHRRADPARDARFAGRALRPALGRDRLGRIELIDDETRTERHEVARVSNTAFTDEQFIDEMGGFDAVELGDERVEVLAIGEEFDDPSGQVGLLDEDDADTPDDGPGDLALEADDVMGDSLSLFLREIGR